MMEACQWNKSSPTGPAEHCEGGSLPISWSSLLILFIDMCVGLLSGLWIYRLFVCSFFRSLRWVHRTRKSSLGVYRSGRKRGLGGEKSGNADCTRPEGKGEGEGKRSRKKSRRFNTRGGKRKEREKTGQTKQDRKRERRDSMSQHEARKEGRPV